LHGCLRGTDNARCLLLGFRYDDGGFSLRLRRGFTYQFFRPAFRVLDNAGGFLFRFSLGFVHHVTGRLFRTVDYLGHFLAGVI